MQRSVLLGRLPWSIVTLAAALLILGCLGIARSQPITGGSRYLTRQLVWSAVCLVVMIVLAMPSYRALARWSYAAFAISVVMLIAVYYFPRINGAHRWIRFGGIGVQPSEFAKLAFVLCLARYLMHRESYRRLAGLCVPLALVMIPLLLVLKEPDLGTAIVFLPVMFAMLYAAGARRMHLAGVVLLAVSTMPLVWHEMSREQRSRITALAEQTQPGERPTADGYHLHQARQVMALGGWTGNLFLDSAPWGHAFQYVPEGHTDSIAIILGARFGLAGWACMMTLYWLLAWRGAIVACNTREPFGRLVATGIVSLVATQVLINLGMLVGLLPITGLTLPLVSYGGSSLLANAMGLGLLLNIGARPGYDVTNEPFQFATA